MKVKITALLAAYNRKDSTVSALENLYQQKNISETYDLDVVLVDDGSTDGTGEAVAEKYPQTQVIKGDGSLFWCGGMCVAYDHIDQQNTDFFLLLNDDTYLYDDAIDRALKIYHEKSSGGKLDQIIVGTTMSPETKELSYGGEVKVSRWHPFRLNHVIPTDEAQSCDTFNGNFVLVHRSVVEKIGFMDRRYTHRFGDTDYGLVAAKAGCGLWITPGFIGECSENPPEINWDSAAYSFSQRVKMFFDVKGMPVRESRVFARKHGGLIWPLIWVMPIVRGLFFPTTYEEEAVIPQQSS